MLRLANVCKTRGEGAQRYRLEIPRLELGPGSRLALVGASGSGKSTVLDLLALVLSPDPGGAFDGCLGGQALDIARLWRDGRHDQLADIRARGFGYVLQTGGLLDFLDVAGNIRLPRQLLGLTEDGTLEHLAEQLDIEALLRRRPGQLSVGQRQRVGIARALAHQPAIVLADEPTASLDPLNAERVMQLLVEQARASCLVIATHDEAMAVRHGLTPLRLSLCRRDEGGVTACLAECR